MKKLNNKKKNDNLKNNYNDLENKFIEVCNKENDLYEENKNLKMNMDVQKLKNINYNNMEFGDELETMNIQKIHI